MTTPAPARAGRIGPNAITRVAQALTPEEFTLVFRDRPSAPVGMVEEGQVVSLHAALRARLGTPRARAVAAEAGRLTGAYLLAHRVPKPLVRWLPRLPAFLSVPLLRRAVTRHAWTFAGTGRFAWRGHDVAMEGCPLCRGARAEEPLCDYLGATFATLLRALVSPRARVRQVECAAMGDAACRFRCDW